MLSSGFWTNHLHRGGAEELGFVELRVEAAGSGKLFVTSAFYDFAPSITRI